MKEKKIYIKINIFLEVPYKATQNNILVFQVICINFWQRNQNFSSHLFMYGYLLITIVIFNFVFKIVKNLKPHPKNEDKKRGRKKRGRKKGGENDSLHECKTKMLEKQEI